MAEQNVEYQSLVQCADDLTQLIQHNVVSLSSKLFAKGLVAKDVHDSVLSIDGVSNQSKAAKLLSCIIDKIKDASGRFQDFIDVLGEDPYFQGIMLKITEVHKTLLDSKVNDFQEDETILTGPESTVESDEKKQVAIVDSNVEVQQLKDKEQVAKRIKMLEKSFLNLKKALLAELKADKKVTTEVLLESLTMLPLELQTEYGAYLEEKLPVLEELGTVSKIFSRLSLHFTFLDYTLIKHLVDEFGSEHLNEDMSAYDREIVMFLDEMTITQLQDHWPGRQELPPHFDRLQMMIDKDPGKCSLRLVNDLRRRFCSETHLSEIVFVLIGIRKANSFIIVFMVPSVLAPRLVESVGGVDDSFYPRECIISISLNQQQLYLSIALREKKAECEKRLLILCASNTGDIQEFTYILSQPGVGPNIHDQDGRTPLVLASNSGRNEVIQLLLKHGVKVDLPNVDSEFGDSPLIGASRYGHVATCQLLIDRGATVDYRHKRDATVLIVASERGHIKVVQLLLDCGAELDIQMKAGRTALAWAAHRGHKQIVDMLLKAGANHDIQDEKLGMTAMVWAAHQGHKQVVDVLLKAGAKIDVQEHEGLTALMVATQYGHKGVVKVLMEENANPNLTNMTTGGTALHLAAKTGNMEIFRMLLGGGADVEVKDKNEMTPFDIAKLHGNEDICDLLTNYYNSQTVKEVTEEQGEQVRKSYQRLIKKLGKLEDILLPGRAEKRRRQTIQGESSQHH